MTSSAAPPDNKMRRLWGLYIGQAGFDILAVIACLLLNQHIVVHYERGAADIRHWAAYQQHFTQLSQLATRQNAPGNSVFGEGDVAAQHSRYAQASAVFSRQLESTKEALLKVENNERRKKLTALLSSVQEHNHRHHAQTERLFAEFRAGNMQEAARHMAHMDGHYQHMATALNHAVQLISNTRRDKLDQQVAHARELRLTSHLMFGIIILMVFATALYGGQLLRRLREESETRLQDVNETRRAQAELEKSQRLLELVMSATQDGVWRMELDNYAVWFSPRWKQMFGYEDHELPNTIETWKNLVHPEDQVEALRLVDEYVAGRIPEFAMVQRYYHKDGSIRYVLSRGVQEADENGRPVRMIGAHTDITELEKAKKQAESATRLKSEFLANMSHEIRTPMNGVIGMAHLLMDTELDARQRGYARSVINSAEALLQIVNDILDFSKIEAGKLDLEHIPFNLQMLVEEITSLMAMKAQEKRVELLLRFGADTPRHVKGDPARVRQVLFNLISNAIKFTESGHVLVEVVHTQTASAGQLRYHFRVEDTGIGIPEGKRDYIFHKFTQADGSTTRKFGGTGLGLAICRNLVTMMGGQIGVDSALGKGSVFWFDITLEQDNALPPPSAMETGMPELLRGARVLLVDDNPAARAVLCEQMSAAGISVQQAASATQALAILESVELPDMLVLDYLMPDMDGLRLAQEIRARWGERAPPLVLVTSSPQRGDRTRMQNAGFSGYVSKPVSGHDLLEVMAHIRAHPAFPPQELVTRHTIREQHAAHPAGRRRFPEARILVAEDNAINRQVVNAILHKMGCIVSEAANGEEAVLMACHQHFDAVFMDVQMPGLDGFEATQMIRAWEKEGNAPRLPIIALTANAMKGDDERCLAAGMDDYLAKPVRQQDIERTLLKWLPPEKLRWSEEQDRAMLPPAESSPVDVPTLEGLRQLMGNDFCGLLDKYFTEAQRLFALLKQAVQEHNLSAIEQHAHSLKSCSHNIGALPFKDHMAQMENAARAGRVEPYRDWLSAAEAELGRVFAQLRGIHKEGCQA